MATNFIQEGDHINVTPVAAVASGGGVVIGSMLGVALGDIAASAPGVAAVDGVWELPKLAADAYAQGDRLYWDTALGHFVSTSVVVGDLADCAVCIVPAIAGSLTVQARLSPGAGAVI